MIEALQVAAVLSCSLFAGAALYINVAEHPARMQCGTELAATVFGPSYRRAAVMQVALALMATIAGVMSWLFTDSLLWMVGALVIFAVIPFTLIAILPTNKQLLSPDLDRRSVHTHRLLVRWGYLHTVRTAASLIATFIFIAAALNLDRG
jgi:uncharacterized membrane protein